MQRWAAVSFDSQSYNVSQPPTNHAPFLSPLNRESVVFDAPYFDLGASESLSGLVGWGAHDPGIAYASRPGSLSEEIVEKFGTYPAQEHIYSFCWPSPERTKVAGKALELALRMRTEISEQCPAPACAQGRTEKFCRMTEIPRLLSVVFGDVAMCGCHLVRSCAHGWLGCWSSSPAIIGYVCVKPGSR